MLLDYEYNNGRLLVSEINDKGNIVFNYYKWPRPMGYVRCLDDDPNKHPNYKTWDGCSVKNEPTFRPDRFAVYEFLDNLPEKEKERLYEYQEPKIYFIDIETEIIDTGFVEPKDANSRVQTIAIVRDRNCFVLGLKELTEKENLKIKKQIDDHFKDYGVEITFKYMSFHKKPDPEKAMLMHFFENLLPKMAVVSGWNFLQYDWTFLINRYRRLGLDPNVSSFTRKLHNIYGTDYEVPAHRLVLDYMEIYKKWDTKIKVHESNSLNWVGEKILNLEHGAKVQYSGSLQDLYNKDFCKYVFYNAVDTVLVQLIHENTQYINIAYSTANLATIRLCDFAYKNLKTTLVQTEGVLRHKFKAMHNIILLKTIDNDTGDTHYGGGWVKPPAKGLNQWVACFDFASLYPTTQQQFRIAPENFKGFQDKNDMGYSIFVNGERIKIEDTDIICNNGAVFRNVKSATVQFLEDTYKHRKEEKTKMKENNIKVDILEKEISELEKELAMLEN